MQGGSSLKVENSGQCLQEAVMQGGSSLKVEIVDSVYRRLECKEAAVLRWK